MYFKQIAVQGLGCLSYVLGCPGKGEMMVVDPKRDVQDYLDIAREEGMRITRVIDTHVHADHVSGAQELRLRTGAEICMWHEVETGFPRTPLHEGDVLEAGVAKLEVLHTPGHTPNSISLLVTDRSRSEEPWMILTGDLLFVGDIGRPDLVGDAVLEEQVRNLYNSLFVKLGKYPDYLEVFPAHGMGSLCGKGMSSKPSTTLGYERRNNPRLAFDNFEDFRREMTQGFPTRPKSFTHIIKTNMEGAAPLEACPLDAPLEPSEFESMMKDGALVVDARSVAAFGGFHIPGAVNIGLEKGLANWVGMVVDPGSDIILVVDDREDYDTMRTELHRIGYDAIFGYLRGGINSWLMSGRPVESLPQISARELRDMADKGADFQLADVRTPDEFAAGRVENALSVPLTEVLEGKPDLDPAREVLVMCLSGYRSNIAASWLKSHGFGNVRSVAGGFTAWTRAGFGISK